LGGFEERGGLKDRKIEIGKLKIDLGKGGGLGHLKVAATLIGRRTC
jgi:hypothetical protein